MFIVSIIKTSKEKVSKQKFFEKILNTLFSIITLHLYTQYVTRQINLKWTQISILKNLSIFAEL